MTAAVVDPVGRKACWLEKISEGGGVWKAGYRKSRTTARSISLVSIGVTDIGRKSEC